MAGAKRTFAAVMAAALLLLAAGCGGGGGSKSTSGTTTSGTAAATTTTEAAPTTPAAVAPLAKAEYVRQMRVIGRSLSKTLTSVSTATTPTVAAKGLTQAQAQLRVAAEKLEAITPPAAVKADHVQLTKAVRDFADELGPVITKVRGGSMAALATIGSLKGVSEILSASTAIANKGYKIGG